MKKFIVITSIFEPSLAIKLFSEITDWQLIVVGDKKTPKDWNFPGVIYLGVEKQSELGFQTFNNLPFNHYARKNLGYLYAIQQGAEWIADLDDDNIPYSNWPEINLDAFSCLKTVINPKFPNMYKYFTSEHIWPRGFPLDEILNSSQIEINNTQNNRIGVLQGLADQDPDVDAIYRLTINKPILFNKREPIVLHRGIYSPFNSQNTIWHRSAFKYMLLPAFVAFRYTDILRSFIAQRCLWATNSFLAFGSATVYQERNPHNYLSDFKSEIPSFLNAKRVTALLDLLPDQTDPIKMLGSCYQALYSDGVITKDELFLYDTWSNDLIRIDCHDNK